jgi:hypothetical protein
MRFRVPDPDERIELLGYLRANGCIAYLVDQQTIEALLLKPTGNDGHVIMALADAWRARRARVQRLGHAG